MQDDVAMDRAIEFAHMAGVPCYTLGSDGWMTDETGRFPDKWCGIGPEPSEYERLLIKAHRDVELAERNLTNARKWLASANAMLDEIERTGL